MAKIVCVFACLALCVSLSVASSDRVVLERARWADPTDIVGVAVKSSGWNSDGPASPDARVRLTIAVKQRNLDQLESRLLKNSDPFNREFYGKHLSHDEVNDLVAPAPASVNAVMQWLTEAQVDLGVLEHSPNFDFVSFTVTIATAERLLNTRYCNYHHDDGKHAVVRVCPPADSYSVPSFVAAHLDFVAPTIRFPRPQTGPRVLSKDVIRQKVGNGTLFVTPPFLRELYQTGTAQGKSASNSQSVAGFIGQFWSPDDLAEFHDLFDKQNAGRKVAKQVGPNEPKNPGDEASLDIQYLMGLGSGVSSWVWYSGNQNTPFLEWVVNVSKASDANVPKLFSVSYGSYENSMTRAYAERLNVEFQKMGARGISIMIAAGDSGVGGNCSNDGRFSPDFPASSPYVTTVGGLEGGDAGKTPTGETGDFISGGGFSDFFARPSYQSAAVKNYLDNVPSKPPAKNFNQTGRGYPDVACQSEMFVIVFDLIPLPGVGGTSCATPTFSGVISLLNDLRLQAGKTSLGFLNPLIYSTAPAHANSFNDATIGVNAGCDLTGFECFKGWDPVTGWGSPNYNILKDVIADLP